MSGAGSACHPLAMLPPPDQLTAIRAVHPGPTSRSVCSVNADVVGLDVAGLDRDGLRAGRPTLGTPRWPIWGWLAAPRSRARGRELTAHRGPFESGYCPSGTGSTIGDM